MANDMEHLCIYSLAIFQAHHHFVQIHDPFGTILCILKNTINSFQWRSTSDEFSGCVYLPKSLFYLFFSIFFSCGKIHRAETMFKYTVI